MPQCLQVQTRKQPMRARTLGAVDFLSLSPSLFVTPPIPPRGGPQPCVPSGTVCAQDLQPTPQHSKGLERWNRTPHREPISLRPSSTETAPLVRLGAADAEGGWIRSRRWGVAEHAASILGEGYCSPPAHVVVFLDFLPRLFCPLRSLSCLFCQATFVRGRRGKLRPPRRCNITQAGNNWVEKRVPQGLGLRELCFLGLRRFVSWTKFTAETTE